VKGRDKAWDQTGDVGGFGMRRCSRLYRDFIRHRDETLLPLSAGLRSALRFYECNVSTGIVFVGFGILYFGGGFGSFFCR